MNPKKVFYIDFVGSPCTTPDGECGMCVGDCDADSDCAGSLRCAQRSGGEDVPGCAWKEGDEAEKADNNDFCEFHFKHLQSLNSSIASIHQNCTHSLTKPIIFYLFQSK